MARSSCPLMFLLIGPALLAAADFQDMRIQPPFKTILASNTLLMDTPGCTLIEESEGNVVILSVAAVVLKDQSPRTRLDAERICQAKALAYAVGEREGIKVAHTEIVEDRTVVIFKDGVERAKSVSDYLEVTQTKIRGVIKGMPVVGKWRSADGKTFYLALGVIVDKDGVPVRSK